MKQTYNVPSGVDEIVMDGKVIWKRELTPAQEYNDVIFNYLNLDLDRLEDSRRMTGRTAKAVASALRKDLLVFLHRGNGYPDNGSIPRSMILSGDTLEALHEKTQGLPPNSLSVDPTAIWVIYRNELKKLHAKIESILKAKE